MAVGAGVIFFEVARSKCMFNEHTFTIVGNWKEAQGVCCQSLDSKGMFS